MNTHHRFGTIADPNSVPNIGKVVGASRALRWLVPLVAAGMIALTIISLRGVGSTGSATLKRSPTVHAVNAGPLIGPEEQAFINRVRHARVDSVGGSGATGSSTTEPLIGPEERAFDRLRARLASIGRVRVLVSTQRSLVGPR